MILTLHAIRRSRSLTKAVLALFCLAWLQVAAVPCLMADDLGVATANSAVAHAAHHACPYCPGAGAGHAQSCDGHGGCTYPHGAQLDARALAAFSVAVPSTPVVRILDERPMVAMSRHAPPADLVPQASFTVSFCRRIE